MTDEIAWGSGHSCQDCHLVMYRYDGDHMDESGSSFVIGCKDRRVQVRLSVEPGVFVHAWQAPSGRAFVVQLGFGMYELPAMTEDGGAVESIDHTGLGPVMGVWGLDDRAIWAWGADGDGPFGLHFDGDAWNRTPIPGPFHAVHGVAPDRVFAVGAGGLIARWDGRRWQTVAPGNQPARRLTDVCVADDGTVYVTEGSGEGALLRVTDAGVETILTTEFPLLSARWFQGALWVGTASHLGVARLVGDQLESWRDRFSGTRLDARGHLLVTSAGDLVSFDGEGILGHPLAVISGQVDAELEYDDDDDDDDNDDDDDDDE